jgi:hypothetical protein
VEELCNGHDWNHGEWIGTLPKRPNFSGEIMMPYIQMRVFFWVILCDFNGYVGNPHGEKNPGTLII